MRRTLLVVGGVLVAAVAGFVLLPPAAPRVTYHDFHDPGRADSWIAFRLTDSTIVLGTAGAAPSSAASSAQSVSLAPAAALCQGRQCRPDVVALAAPIDDDRQLLAVEPLGRWLISTSLAAAYQPNSLRLKSLSVAVTDHRLEAINTIGVVATGLRPLASPVAEAARGAIEAEPLPLALPLTLDLAWLKRASDWTAIPAAPGWEAKAAFLDNPASEGFIARADLRRLHGAAVSSTCRPLRVEIRSLGQADLVYVVRVADPDWLTPVPLPPTGAVVFQPLCGADVQAEKTVTVGTDALAQAIFNQVGAIRAAGTEAKPAERP